MKLRLPISRPLRWLVALAVLFGLREAQAYTLLGVRWPGSHPRVPFYVSTSCDGHAPYNGPFEDGIRAITNAAHVWNSQGDSHLKFFYAGITEVTNVANDGINAIIWSPQQCPYPDTGCVAECILHRGADQTIEGFDVVLHARRAGDGLPLYWTASLIVDGIDVWSIVLHEFGHALGLGHSQTQAIMAPGCGPGCVDRNLAVDDRNGIQALYGPYTNEGLWASNPNPVPGETVTLFLDYPRATGQQFQIVADFDGPATGCPLRNQWPADSRIFPLDRCPWPIGSSSPTPQEYMVLPASTGVLDSNGQAQVTVRIQGPVSCAATNQQWHFAAVTYDPNLSPSGIEDVGVAVALDIQSPPGPQLLARRAGPPGGDETEVRWEARAHYAYQMERSSTLTNWTTLGPLLPARAGGAWLTGWVGVAQSAEFVRVRALAPANPPCDGGGLAFLLSTNYVRITSVSKSFTVQLTGPPTNAVTVAVTRTSGEPVFVVSEGNNHVFTATNWSAPHTVTISQTGDVVSNNTATFTVLGRGVSDAVVTVVGRLQQ